MQEIGNALQHDGFAITAPIFNEAQCQQILTELADMASLPQQSAGSRNLLHQRWCQTLALQLQQSSLLAPILENDTIAVQCTYFEKSAQRNWLVAPHQDLSIPVAARIEHPAWRGWTQKEGIHFVQPPDMVLKKMLAVRLQLDSCTTDDGVLRVIPASHHAGRLSSTQIAQLKKTEVRCNVAAGAVLLMRPLLVHASSRSSGEGLRRVLHFVFGPRELPDGVRWGYFS